MKAYEATDEDLAHHKRVMETKRALIRHRIAIAPLLEREKELRFALDSKERSDLATEIRSLKSAHYKNLRSI